MSDIWKYSLGVNGNMYIVVYFKHYRLPKIEKYER